MASLLGDLRKLEKDRNEIEELKAIEQNRIVSLTDGRHPKKKRAKLKNDKILSNDIELKEIRAKIAEKEAEIERINSQLERDSQEDIDAYNNYLNELERVAKLRKNRLGKKVLTSNGDIKEYEESELDYTRITKARESFREYTNKVTPAEYLRSNRTGKRYPSIDESTVERLYREKTFNAGVVPESVFKRKKKQQEAIAKKQAQSIDKNNTADTKESLSNDNIINEENQSSLNEVLDTDSNDSVWANRPSISELRDQIAMYDAQISDMHIDMDKEIERFMQSVDERIKALFEEKESERSYTNPKETKKQLDYIGELSTAVRRRFNKSVVEASIGNLSEEDLNKISEDYKKITDFLEEFEEYAQQNVSDSDKYDKLFGFFDDLSSESIESIHSEKFFNKEKIPEAIQEYIKERPERDPLLDDIKNQRNSHLEYFEELEKAAARRKDKAALDVVLGKNTFEAYKNTESDYKGISKARLEFNEYAKNTSLKDFSKDNKLAQFLETMSPTVLKSLHSQKGFDKSKIPVDILERFYGGEGKDNELVDSNKFDRNQRNRPTSNTAKTVTKAIALIAGLVLAGLKILHSILNKLDNLGKKTIESDLEFHKTLINSTTRFGYDRAGRVLGIDGNRFVNMVTDFRESFNPLTGIDETKLRNLALLLHKENDTGSIAESVTNFTTPQEYLSYLMDILDRQYKEIISIKDPNERASVLNQKIQLMEKFSPDMAAILGAMYAQNYTEGPYQGMIKSVDDLFRIADFHSQTNNINAFENALRNLSKAIDELLAKFGTSFSDIVTDVSTFITGLMEKLSAFLPDEREAIDKTLESAEAARELVTERKKEIEQIKKGSEIQAEKAVKEAGFTQKEGPFWNRQDVPIPVEDIMAILEAGGTNLISPLIGVRQDALRSENAKRRMKALLKKRFEDQLIEQKIEQGLDGELTQQEVNEIDKKVKSEQSRLQDVFIKHFRDTNKIRDLAAENAISAFLVAVDMQEKIAEKEEFPISYKAKDFSNETMSRQTRALQEDALQAKTIRESQKRKSWVPTATLPIDAILESLDEKERNKLLSMPPAEALGYLAGKSEDTEYMQKIKEQFFSEKALKKAKKRGQQFPTLESALDYLKGVTVSDDAIQEFFIRALKGDKINTALFRNRLIVNAMGKVTDKETVHQTARTLLNKLLGSEREELKNYDRGVVEYKGAPNSNVVFTIKLMQGDKVVYEDTYESNIQAGGRQTIEGQVNLDSNGKME